MNREDQDAFSIGKEWFRQGEFAGSIIVFEALWKKHPHEFAVLLAFADAQERINPLKALDFYSEILAGEGAWLRFLQNIPNVERAILFERHGMLCFTLKDEISALDSLRRAVSLGQDNLQLWSTLALLFSAHHEPLLAKKALLRSLTLYHEPTLFCTLGLNQGITVNENFFSTISLTLLPELHEKDAHKLLSAFAKFFPDGAWVKKLQQIVVKAPDLMPIEKSGETYVGSDAKNW